MSLSSVGPPGWRVASPHRGHLPGPQSRRLLEPRMRAGTSGEGSEGAPGSQLPGDYGQNGAAWPGSVL